MSSWCWLLVSVYKASCDFAPACVYILHHMALLTGQVKHLHAQPQCKATRLAPVHTFRDRIVLDKLDPVARIPVVPPDTKSGTLVKALKVYCLVTPA